MEKLIRIGLDTSKRVFQLHGVDEAERPVLRRKMTRDQMIAFFQKLPPTPVGIEACGASHHWARLLGSFGHEVRLLPPQYVKAYVKRGKNDKADAEAICEAMSRPSMRFVPVKSIDQQAGLMLQRTRALLVRQQTQVSNAIRGHAAELGIVAAKGLCKISTLLQRIAQAASVPENARLCFDLLGDRLAELDRQIAAIDERLRSWHRTNGCSRRLAAIPGVGEKTATHCVMAVTDPHGFRSARHFSAWIGLTPKDHSTAGRTRLGVITRAGDKHLRSLLVVGATAVIQQVSKGRGRHPAWLVELVKRKPPKLAAVALANKNARIIWKLMTSGEAYRADHQSRPVMANAA
jgi:transposase